MSVSDQLARYLLAEAGVACPVTPVLITEENCKPCQESKEELKQEISRGDVRVLSVAQEEAIRLMKKAGVDMVPQLFVVDCNGDIVEEIDLKAEQPGAAPIGKSGDDEIEQQVLSGIKAFVSGGRG